MGGGRKTLGGDPLGNGRAARSTTSAALLHCPVPSYPLLPHAQGEAGTQSPLPPARRHAYPSARRAHRGHGERRRLCIPCPNSMCSQSSSSHSSPQAHIGHPPLPCVHNTHPCRHRACTLLLPPPPARSSSTRSKPGSRSRGTPFARSTPRSHPRAPLLSVPSPGVQYARSNPDGRQGKGGKNGLEWKEPQRCLIARVRLALDQSCSGSVLPG
ncbi:hypothetical protein CALCODRAFT_100472 [Calocera cornea HHB12733]|uniref:Uncharacterized protein n=1 Tax=Calocera cornea HHB12733 TaxID=1353952 RepID=A0A165D6A1_9BASI|nr:hypothetical protein CALCODRAFT_100472 [Calocera cornea HHB12733]